MFVTRKALKEPPSLEVILARIGDIYKAQEFTQKILFEMPISSNSQWAAALGVLNKSAADSIIKELRSRGAYSDEMRAVLPLTVYVTFGETILGSAETEGQYPNLMAAIAALTGNDMASANESYNALKALEKEYLDMAGELAIRQNKYQATLDIADRDSILAQRNRIKEGKKKLKVQRKDLTVKLKAVLAGNASANADISLQSAVYNALSYAYRLNESAIDAAIAVGIQSVKVIPEIPNEIKTLGPRLLKDGIDGIKESIANLGDFSGLNSEDFAKALLSQIRIGEGGLQIDMDGFGSIVQSDDKLGALRDLAPDILSQVLDKAKGDALAPVTDLVNNAFKAPERITKSIDLVQFNVGLLNSLNQKSVTGGKRLGKSIIDLPVPTIKIDEKKLKQADSAMQANVNAMNEKIKNLSPRNLEISASNISLGFVGLPGSKIYTTHYNGLYGFGDVAQYGDDSDELASPGRGFSMNVLNCLTEKSDFIRSAMMYNVGYIAAGSDKNSPDGMAEISGGDFNVNYTFLKDPFFFLPHVIGSGPAAVEWFAGGGIGLDFGFGFRSLSRTSKAWSDVYSDSSAYRGDITDLRFVWNNAVSAGGFVRLFDGTLSVTGLYSKYFPHASLLNLGFTSVDVPEKDTAYNKPWKFSDYEYEFDQDHAGQNLFGLGNFIASGFYEGGYSTTITARASVPVNVRPVTDWFIRQSEKTGNIKPWQRMFKTYLGISLNFTRSSHEYSIKKGRDKLGVTNPANNGHLIEDDGMYYYDVDQNSISIMLDMSINSDYVALGAR